MIIDVIDFVKKYRKYYNTYCEEWNFEFNNLDIVKKTLLDFSRRKQTVYTLYAWDILIENLPEICFTRELVRFLCENKIGVIALAHKDFDDDCLMIIAEYCQTWLPEPFEKIISRILKNDSISVAKMDKIYKPLSNYAAIELCLQENMLYNITETKCELEKIFRLIEWLSEDSYFDKISKKFQRFYNVKYATAIDFKMLVRCDIYEWLGLMQNKTVPLEKLYMFCDFDTSSLSYFEYVIYRQTMCLFKFRQYMSI